MKYLILLILLLTLSTTLSTTEPIPIKGDCIDNWMIERYSNWWDWKQKDRDAVRKMFITSVDKHAWFPDKFDKPPVKKFTIYPKGYHEKRMDELKSR